MGDWWLWTLVFLTFNLPIAAFLIGVPFGKRLNQVLKEKAPDGTATEATSYSRVTGALGAVILTSFFWAIGNATLSLALKNVTEVKPLLDAVVPFFLIGSALFLPYAFNQLKSLLPWSANAAVAIAQMNQGSALARNSPPPQIGPAPARLVIANLSSVDDTDLSSTLAAIQMQIDRHFQPEWGVGTTLSHRRMTLAGPKVLLDAATDAIIYLGDQAQDPSTGVSGLLGHHALTHPNVPYGFIFLDVCKKKGQEWSVILSHEVLELLADPQANARAVGPNPKHPSAPNVSFELEVCDPSEADSYLVNGVSVSNFVNRRYFGWQGHSSSTNQMDLALKPFGVRPGGYIQYYDGDGIQIFDGGAVTAGQLGARAMMGSGRRNTRRAMATSPVRAAPSQTENSNDDK